MVKFFIKRNRLSTIGFTLVELLIVIAILAILAAAVVIVINPGEMLVQARDSQRVTDLQSVRKAIDLFIIDNSGTSLGTTQRVYISIPDTASNCPNLTSSLPILPTGWAYVCATSANVRNTDSTGWIPLNLSLIKGGSPISSLPIDPVNDAVSGKYYTYVMGGSYELTALMEAQKTNASVSDGGSLPGVFETGTNITLTPPTRDKGLVGYWTFDGTGSIANNQTTGLADSSGKGNNGTAINTNGTGMIFTTGKVGNAVQLDGVDDYVNCGSGSQSLRGFASGFSIGSWFKWQAGTNAPLVLLSGSTGAYSVFGTGNKPLIFRSSTNYRYFTPTISVIDGNWHYLVFTSTGNALNDIDNSKVYIDGIEQIGETSTKSGLPDAINGNCKIGGGNGYMTGLVDDVRVYDRALSVEEVKTIYNATK